MRQRREFVRFKVPFCVQYNDLYSSLECLGVIRDINMGGVKVLVDTPLKIIPERFVSLSIFFPDDTLEVRGRVVWVKEFKDRKEVGICFLDNFDPSKDVFNYIMKYFKEETTGRGY